MFSALNPPYQIIYADPPWTYKDKCHAGKRGVEYKYKTMPYTDLARMPVTQLCDNINGTVLFMWVTMPQIQVGLDLMAAWTFRYKTAAFTWVKTNKRSGSLFWGMGNWTRSNPEICLLGVRKGEKGLPKRQSAHVHSVILQSRIGRHSAKPAETRDRIVQLLGDVPRVELFARERVSGWDVWGNEVQ